jgi:predicted aldo/keto reductase-like oxidoreductase
MISPLDSPKRNAAGMPLRRLGKSGIEVSLLGFGGGHIAREHMSEADSVRLLQSAIDQGVTFLDNAWEYADGEAERRMGLGIQGRRDQVVLMTKVCARDAKGAEEQLHDSLKRFQTDHIDVWQFHEINYDNDPEWITGSGGALETAIKAKEQGKIRSIGFTAHKSPHIVKKMLDQGFEWDSVQIPITVMDPHYRSFISEILPILNERDIGCIGMKSLGGEGQFVANAKLSPQDCRRFAMSQPISTLVTGMESLENVDQDAGIARDFVPMSETEQTALLESVQQIAGDGRHEWYKSTQFYDSPCHRNQHEFPPIGHVNSDQTIPE